MEKNQHTPPSSPGAPLLSCSRVRPAPLPCPIPPLPGHRPPTQSTAHIDPSSTPFASGLGSSSHPVGRPVAVRKDASRVDSKLSRGRALQGGKAIMATRITRNQVAPCLWVAFGPWSIGPLVPSVYDLHRYPVAIHHSLCCRYCHLFANVTCSTRLTGHHGTCRCLASQPPENVPELGPRATLAGDVQWPMMRRGPGPQARPPTAAARAAAALAARRPTCRGDYEIQGAWPRYGLGDNDRVPQALSAPWYIGPMADRSF